MAILADFSQIKGESPWYTDRLGLNTETKRCQFKEQRNRAEVIYSNSDQDHDCRDKKTQQAGTAEMERERVWHQ